MSFICPKIVHQPSAMQTLATSYRHARQIIGFVPTMGCLHEGHLSLMREAKKQCDIVIVSIFVNPLQFGPKEDFSTYPRTFERDLELCSQAGVDVVFAPTPKELYPSDFTFKVLGGPLANLYCGASRPGFFDGVLTVVSILFHLTKPHKAFFGEKDFQQLFLVKQLARQLFFSVDVIGMPIVREHNQLAMSSRNHYLSEEQKNSDALVLYNTLCLLQKQVSNGCLETSVLRQHALELQKQVPSFECDYIAFVHESTFEPVQQVIPNHTRLLLAGYLTQTSRVRLIDNGRL